MLIIRTPHYFSRKITLNVPLHNTLQTETFEAVFKIVSYKEAKKTPQTDLFLSKILIDAKDIYDEEKKPIPFNETLKNTLIYTPYIAIALVKAYWEGLKGEEEKN